MPGCEARRLERRRCGSEPPWDDFSSCWGGGNVRTRPSSVGSSTQIALPCAAIVFDVKARLPQGWGVTDGPNSDLPLWYTPLPSCPSSPLSLFVHRFVNRSVLLSGQASNLRFGPCTRGGVFIYEVTHNESLTKGIITHNCETTGHNVSLNLT